MATKDVKYTNDGSWQVEIVAFKTDFFFYKAIGTTITVRRKETQKSWFGWGSTYEAWIERSADSISITNIYEGILPSTVAGVASRNCSESNRSSCDCRLWSAGIGISMEASPSPGTPDWDTSRPSSGARLEVRSVRGSGSVVIDGNVIHVGEVQAS